MIRLKGDKEYKVLCDAAEKTESEINNIVLRVLKEDHQYGFGDYINADPPTIDGRSLRDVLITSSRRVPVMYVAYVLSQLGIHQLFTCEEYDSLCDLVFTYNK